MEQAKETTPEIQALAEKLVNLSIKEVQGLLSCLKSDHGIEPAAVAGPQQVVVANDGAAQEEKEEKTIFNVMLKEAGSNKINVIKAIRKITGLGLKDCKAVADDAGMVKENVPKAEAEAMKKDLEDAGATVDLQ